MLRALDAAAEARADAAPAKALLSLRGVRLEAEDRALLRDVDLDIAAGRRTVVMGANGAGKSLLLRLMHGLIAPTSGGILWRGRPLDRAARRAQAMVFQRPVLLRRSALDNLRFALAARGVPRTARRALAEQALARARLDAVAHRPARLLSGGEQQRLALARALLCDPELLLLDEPTASLDPASTHAIEALLGEAAATGVTVVIVTHDSGQARRLGDDVAFLNAGRVVETGPARRVLDAPASAAARAWLDGRLHFDP